jgi:hypothetical protein
MYKKHNLLEFQKIARKQGGKCLSKSYSSIDRKLKFECKFGHKWSAVAWSVYKGSWCIICGNVQSGLKRRTITIEKLNLIAKSNQGFCLSKTYEGANSNATWKCKNNHVWDASVSSVMAGRWCRECGIASSTKKRSNTIEDAQKYAHSREGKCTSKTYTNSRTKLNWECKFSHTWSAVFSSKNQTRWCPTCAEHEKIKRFKKGLLSLSDMHKLAAKQDGFCISTSYVNSQTHLDWKCSNGHIFSAKPSNVQTGHWCPYCKNDLGENTVRQIFEIIFDSSFKRVRPLFLKTIKGGRLELDGFNEELKIAFEHHGRHHYKVSHFSKSKHILKQRIKLDTLKEKLCKKNGIKLIVVPEVGEYVALNDLYRFIVTELKKNKIRIPKHKPFNLNSQTFQQKSSQLQRLSDEAKKRNWVLLSTVYIGFHNKHDFICENKHTISITPGHFLNGRGCAVCSGKVKGSIEEMQKLASSKNGVCLSKVYVNRKTKLIWQCDKGHKWETIPNVIIKGHWCPYCAGQRI